MTFAAGKFDQAFSLNGTNAYVSVPDAPALRLGTEFTVDFWVNKASETADFQLLVGDFAAELERENVRYAEVHFTIGTHWLAGLPIDEVLDAIDESVRAVRG